MRPLAQLLMTPIIASRRRLPSSRRRNTNVSEMLPTQPGERYFGHRHGLTNTSANTGAVNSRVRFRDHLGEPYLLVKLSFGSFVNLSCPPDDSLSREEQDCRLAIPIRSPQRTAANSEARLEAQKPTTELTATRQFQKIS